MVSVGKNLPAWVNESFAEYAKRLPQDFALDLSEVTPLPRTKNHPIAQIKRQEGELLLLRAAKITASTKVSSAHNKLKRTLSLPSPAITSFNHGNSLLVALDEHGMHWSTQELAQHLNKWHDNWSEVVFLVGGADGLSDECLQCANVKWSLSKLTFPHHLVRVIVAEQLYRAWSLLHHHPYHRA